MPLKEVLSDRRVVAPGATLTLANVATISGIAVGALYGFHAHPSKAGRYQVRYQSGAVSNPLAGLGTGLLTPANTYQVTLNSDGSINVADTSVAPVNFGTSLSRGDTVYIAGSRFGDTGPFGSNNQGFWTVVATVPVGANPGAQVVLKRVDPTEPLGTAETVTSAAALDLQKVVSASAVLLIGAPAYAGIWDVKEAAAGWLSIDSATPLPVYDGVSLTALSIITSDFVGYARIEVDGLAVVSYKSGDLSQGSQVLRPVRFADPLAAPVGGWTELYGLITLLTVQNVTDQPVNVNTIIAYLVD